MKKILLILVVMAIMGNALSAYARDVSFTPLESPAIYSGDDIDRISISYRKGGVKAPSFLTGFTQEDRDRIIRLEIKVEEGQKSLQRQIDDLKISIQRQIDDLKTSTQRQFDNLYTLILWGFGILFGGMGILIGFVIWDRRTALAPAIKKNKELEERGDLLERALKEFAKQEPRLAEVLRTMRLM